MINKVNLSTLAGDNIDEEPAKCENNTKSTEL